MRKIFTIVLAVAGLLTASAADYVAYSNGKLAENINFNGWWNIILSATEANPDGDGQVIKMTYNPNEPGGGATGANFCGGLQVNGGTTIAGPLSTSTMTFSYYATTPCKINIQLGCGVNETQVINVTDADVNKWNDVSYSIATDFPQVSAKWNEYGLNGAADIMGIIVEQIQEGSILYINNVVYKDINEAWTVPAKEAIAAAPVPTQPATSVISLYGSHYQAATTFNIGGWGQSTIVINEKDADGNDVEALENFNYLGWELVKHLNVSKCDYMHVDYYAKEGNTFALTPISPGPQEKVIAMKEVKTGEWNSYDIPLTEWSNVNFEDLFQIKFDQGNGGSGYITNVYFYNSNGENVSNEDEKPEIPMLDPTLMGNLWNQATITLDQPYYAPNGAIRTDYTETYEDGVLSITLPGATYGEWQGQFPLDTNIEMLADEEYDFSFTITSDTDATVFFKLFQKGDDVNVACEESMTLKAGEAYNYENKGITGKAIKPVRLLFDIRNNPDNTTIEVKDIVLNHNVADAVEVVAADNAAAVYYNLHGQRVANPENGLYIVVKNGKATKVFVK